MKKLIILFLLAFTGMQLSAQKAERITGMWWNAKKTAKIEIKKEANGSFSGTIVYLVPEKYKSGVPPKDDKNPDPKLCERSVLGLTVLSELRYDAGKKEWDNGRIYDPRSGKTYKCYVWMEDRDDMLFIKGYAVGIRWMGKLTEWTRPLL